MTKNFLEMLLINLPLGTMLIVVILWFYQRKIYAQTNDLGKYFLEQSHKPHKSDSEDKFLRWMLIWLTYYSVILAIYTIAVAQSGTLISDHQINALNETAKNLRTGTDLMLTITVTTTLILATFRKPYYILFGAQDVANKYHLLECVIPAILTRLFAIINLIVANLLSGETEEAIYLTATFLNAEIWLLSITCFLCFYVFIRIYRIFFSVETAELSLLNNLRQHLYDPDCDLKSILIKENGQELKNLTAVENYLIEQLQIKASKAKKALRNYIKLSGVEYLDTSSTAPLQGKRQYLFQAIWLLLLIIFSSIACVELELMGLSIFEFVNNKQMLTIDLSLLFSNRFCIFIMIFYVLIFVALLNHLFNSPRLSPIIRALTYGRYGYCFLDEDDVPRYYFSRYTGIQRKPAKWLCALLNLLTLYQIELLNNRQNELLENLCSKLSTEKDEIKRFSLELAHASCCALLLNENPSKSVNINEIPRTEWGYECKNELFIDFVCAVLSDAGKPLNIQIQHIKQ